MPSWSLRLPLCLGGKTDRSKKIKKSASERAPQTKTAAAAAAATELDKDFQTGCTAMEQHQKLVAYFCPQCGSSLGCPGQQDRTGIRANPWSTVRMQKSVDSGICEELSVAAYEPVRSRNSQQTQTGTIAVAADDADGDAESDTAADLEVSNIVGGGCDGEDFQHRRQVVEGVALRGFVSPSAGWHAAATVATLPRDSASSCAASTDDEFEELDGGLFRRRKETTQVEQQATGKSEEPSQWAVHQPQMQRQEYQLLQKQRRSALLWAMASVRDQLNREMERLLEAKTDDLAVLGDGGWVFPMKHPL